MPGEPPNPGLPVSHPFTCSRILRWQGAVAESKGTYLSSLLATGYVGMLPPELMGVYSVRCPPVYG